MISQWPCMTLETGSPREQQTATHALSRLGTGPPDSGGLRRTGRVGSPEAGVCGHRQATGQPADRSATRQVSWLTDQPTDRSADRHDRSQTSRQTDTSVGHHDGFPAVPPAGVSDGYRLAFVVSAV